MTALFISVPIGFLLLAIAVAAFFWAVRSGQFDDLDTPAYSVLMDDDEPRPQQTKVWTEQPPGRGGDRSGQ